MDITTYALLNGKIKDVDSKLAGKADLVDGKIPADELPSYVDDVVEYASLAEFPEEGEQSKIYVALDTGFTYRWTGTEYIQIGGQDLSDYYTKDQTDQLLDTKQPVGDYATNSALEAGLATKQPVGDYATRTELTSGLATKQDTISDLNDIRSGAALGATSVQPTDVSAIPELDIRRLFRTEYFITTLITNGTYSGDSSIWTEETAAVTLVADNGYSLPETIVVSGAAYTYDNATGVIALSTATGNVSISAECDPVVPPTDMPNKGDIITLNGETQRYRVLKVTGNVAQLMRLGYYQSSMFSGGTTKTFDNGSKGLKYGNSSLDSLLNTTYYNSLSSNIKNAIVEESRIQNMYSRADGSSASADFRMQRNNGNWYSYTKTDQTTVGQRNVYALDAYDIAEYLGTDIVYTDLLNMLFEQTTTVSRSIWTSSAYASSSIGAWIVYGPNGYLDNDNYNDYCEVFPAFSIDLSQVTWTAE